MRYSDLYLSLSFITLFHNSYKEDARRKLGLH